MRRRMPVSVVWILATWPLLLLVGSLTVKQVGSSLWGCSTESAALTEEAMLKIIEGVPGGSADRTRGLTQSMGSLRKEFLSVQFIRDEGLVTSAVYH